MSRSALVSDCKVITELYVLAYDECRYDGTGQLYYNLEYTVKAPQFFRHNISVYAAR